MQDNREIRNMTLLLGPPFNPDPCFNLKPCYLQSEGILLNQGRNSVPQYLMHKIQVIMAATSTAAVKALRRD
jgi:hypothetical protein